jgi:transmembrane sensor
MSNVVELPNKEQIYDQASLWVAKLDRELSIEERREFQQWLHQHKAHRTTFIELARLWDKMDSLARLADLFQAPAPVKTKKYSYLAVAASVLLLIVSTLSLSNSENRTKLYSILNTNAAATSSNAIYETALGEHSTINLSDGSVLILNTNSRVHVKYTAEQRLFLLERGEINIEVAHNKSRPLSVVAGDKIVQAVGTAFNVRIQNDKEVELLVTDGKVLIAEQQTSQPIESIKPKRLNANSMSLTKGEKIVLGAAREKITKIIDSDINAELSWRQGNIIFRGETLEQALAEVSRYTAVEFEISDNNIKHQRIAGLFKAGDVNGLLQTLDQNFNIHNERINNNKVRLMAR